MGKIYKNKKSSGCSLCKPHKHKKADKLKPKIRDLYNRTEREIRRQAAEPLIPMKIVRDALKR